MGHQSKRAQSVPMCVMSSHGKTSALFKGSAGSVVISLQVSEDSEQRWSLLFTNHSANFQ